MQRAAKLRSGGLHPGLVTGLKNQRRLLGVVESGFHRGEVLQHRGPQAVDRSDPVEDQVRASSGQQPQIGADLVATSNRLQIGAHPGLVGDDPCVLGIGLAVTAVGRRCVVTIRPGM